MRQSASGRMIGPSVAYMEPVRLLGVFMAATDLVAIPSWIALSLGAFLVAPLLGISPLRTSSTSRPPRLALLQHQSCEEACWLQTLSVSFSFWGFCIAWDS